MKPRCEVGQIYASTHREDRGRGWNQRRAVLELTEKRRWIRTSGERRLDLIPAAVLTCDGNGGKMRSTVMLDPDGSLPRHTLVSQPDPHLKAIAETFRGIIERAPYSYLDKYPAAGEPATADLADMVYQALLWPRHGGKQNPRIEVALHQDALQAIGERILELVAVVEQNALASTFMPGGNEPDGGMLSLEAQERANADFEAADLLWLDASAPEHMPELTAEPWEPGNPADEGPEL